MIMLLSYLDIVDIWARPGIKGGATAVYMVIRNNDTLADTLYEVRSEISKKAEIHKSFVDKEGNVGMKRIEYLVIPPNGEVQLKPGGDHIMLIGLKEPLRGGKRFGLTLIFKRAKEVAIEAEVK